MDNTGYFNLEVKKIEEDKDNHIFEGYAAVFGNKDYGNDIIMPGAFKDSLAGPHKVKILWMHDRDQPLGVPLELREDNKGLFLKGTMPKEDIFVKQRVMPQLRIGSLEMSIGYKIKDQDFKDNTRYIKEAFIFEASLVSIGMNNQAQILSYKSLDMDNIKDLDERELEAMFKEGFKSSNKMAKMLVSLIKADNQRDVDDTDGRDAHMIQDMKNIKYKKMMDEMSKIKNKIK